MGLVCIPIPSIYTGLWDPTGVREFIVFIVKLSFSTAHTDLYEKLNGKWHEMFTPKPVIVDCTGVCVRGSRSY